MARPSLVGLALYTVTDDRDFYSVLRLVVRYTPAVNKNPAAKCDKLTMVQYCKAIYSLIIEILAYPICIRRSS